MSRVGGDDKGVEQLLDVLDRVKPLAARYYSLTGRPLGITGEVAEYEAARLLGVEPSPVRQSGYDAIRRVGRRIEYLQIKGRCLPKGSKSGQRLGAIRLDAQWDAVLMVLLDESFEATVIHEADRSAIAEGFASRGQRPVTNVASSALPSSSRSDVRCGRRGNFGTHPPRRFAQRPVARRTLRRLS